MSENLIPVDVDQYFASEEYGMIEAHKRYQVREDVAQRWIEEGKAHPVIEAKVETAKEVIETPEDSSLDHETASLKRKKK